jgi:hypothetical protein
MGVLDVGELTRLCFLQLGITRCQVRCSAINIQLIDLTKGWERESNDERRSVHTSRPCSTDAQIGKPGSEPFVSKDGSHLS